MQQKGLLLGGLWVGELVEGSAEEKVYWMDIVRKRAGFRPTSQLVAPK